VRFLKPTNQPTNRKTNQTKKQKETYSHDVLCVAATVLQAVPVIPAGRALDWAKWCITGREHIRVSEVLRLLTAQPE